MKNRSLIIAALALMTTNYLAFQAGQSNLYYKAGAASRSSTSRTPQGVYGVNQVLQYAPTRIDFGTVEDGQSHTRSVTFQNTGKEPVSIQQAKASCSCTTVRLVSGSDVPPGGHGNLEIGFNPALSSPEFSISISVSYRGRNEIDRLLVSGRIDRNLEPPSER